MHRLTAESNTVLSSDPLTLSKQPDLPALTYLKVDGHLRSWSGAALQLLVQLLCHAPLLHLDLVHAPLHQLHHLSTLVHLRSLLTSASVVGMHNMGEDMPSELHSCLRTASVDSQGWHGDWADMQRRLSCDHINVETMAVTDELLTVRADRGLISVSSNIRQIAGTRWTGWERGVHGRAAVD